MTVVARNIGRLGNNMFQIAAAIGYARKYGYKWGVDPSSGHGEPYSSIHKVFPNLPKADPSGVRYHEHANAWCNRHNMHYDECHFDYHNIPDMGGNVKLTGFYQSWKYFEHCKEEVKEVFKLPHVEGYEEYVSIHVRRGDYVQHAGSFPPVTESYIDQAILAVKHKGIDIRNVIFFSDEIQWCKDKFPSLGKITSHFDSMPTGQDHELKKLSIMASCGHHIIANSSFSWWASYLGHNPNRITVSPSAETWFGPTAGVKKPVVDLIPDSWIQIPTR